MVRKTLTMWMPKRLPPTPWKLSRFTSAPAAGGPGSQTTGTGGGGGGGGGGIRGGGGGGGAISVVSDGGADGLRKKLGRPSGPGDAGPAAAMSALSVRDGQKVNLWETAERAQHHVWGDGLPGHASRQGRQRVVHRIQHRARRARGARLARALEAALGEGGGRLHVTHHDVRHLGRHGHQIVGHGGGEKLPGLVVDAVLEEGGADALDDGAANLLVHQPWIDDAAAIFHRPVAEKPDEAGVRVHLHVGELDAIGEGETLMAGHIVTR